MAELKPRIARGLNGRPDFILFTYASNRAPLIAGVLFKPRPTRELQLTKGRIPAARMRRFRIRNKIFGSELLHPLAFAWTHRKLLANSTCTFCLDGNNAITAPLLGDSCDGFIAAMVATFWRLAQQLGMAV